MELNELRTTQSLLDLISEWDASGPLQHFFRFSPQMQC